MPDDVADDAASQLHPKSIWIKRDERKGSSMAKPEEPRLVGVVIGGGFDGQSAVFAVTTFAEFALNPEEVWRLVNREIDEATVKSRGGVVWRVRRLTRCD